MPDFLKQYWKIFAGLSALLLIAAFTLTFGRQAPPLPTNSESAARLLPGPHEVRSYQDVFVDTTRASQAHGEYAGDSSRRLEATVWHPADSAGAPYPLIVYSHGFSSSRQGGAYLAEHLAAWGYVVVAADFPLTNMLAPDRPWVRDVVNQPGDVSFLIDSLLAQSGDTTHALSRMVDSQRIGVTGISLGGMTSTLVAFHPAMGDRRVKAALSIAGPTAQFTDAFFRASAVPFLMLAGDIDAIVPYRYNALPVLEKVPDAQLVTVTSASHTGFAGPAASLRWMDNPDALGCYMVNRNIENDLEESWLDQLGTPEQGIDYDAPNGLCELDPLPVAMNPLRQHMITALVVRAFFDSQFARDGVEREAAASYLREVLPVELEEVTYSSVGER